MQTVRAVRPEAIGSDRLDTRHCIAATVEACGPGDVQGRPLATCLPREHRKKRELVIAPCSTTYPASSSGTHRQSHSSLSPRGKYGEGKYGGYTPQYVQGVLAPGDISVAAACLALVQALHCEPGPPRALQILHRLPWIHNFASLPGLSEAPVTPFMTDLPSRLEQQ